MIWHYQKTVYDLKRQTETYGFLYLAVFVLNLNCMRARLKRAHQQLDLR